jgi:hypothetical protein
MRRSCPWLLLSLLILCGGLSAQKVLEAKEFVAKKRALHAIPYKGNFSSGVVYEVRANLKGFVARNGEKIALLETGNGTLEHPLTGDAAILQSGSSWRALMKLGANDALEIWAFAEESACERLDPTPKPQSETEKTRQTLNSRKGKREPIFPDNLVKAYQYGILYFNPKMDAAKARSLAHAVLYYSEKAGVDARLVMAVIACESGFRENALSPKGAMGLGQLMPGTAKGAGVTNPWDPIDNIAGSIRLIGWSLDAYKGKNAWDRICLALATYNAGGSAVRRYGGVPPYRQTVNYINNVTSLYRKLCGY